MSFVHDFKRELVHISDLDFEQKTLSLFHYQYANSIFYRQFVDALGISVGGVQSYLQIPFMPIEFFKYHRITSTEADYMRCFESSGTTDSIRSRLYVYDEPFYWQNCVHIFERFFGAMRDYSFFFLLPSYLERSNSSLVSMANHFYNCSDKQFGGFYLDDFQTLAHELQRALAVNPKKVVLWGVTFALLDFAEYFSNPMPQLTVVETGGMKGRGKEPLRSEVHQLLKTKWQLTHVCSEYGMTELFSQGYAMDDDVFSLPSHMRVVLREIDDPLSVHLRQKERGGINVIDLANIDTCAFIATQDIGVLQQNGFQVLGRFDTSDIRGCSLMAL